MEAITGSTVRPPGLGLSDGEHFHATTPLAEIAGLDDS